MVGRNARNNARPARIALVGADGAGKSTISSMLERSALPYPVKRIYMGVNLDASTDMLPTTRMLLAAKQLRARVLRGPSRGPRPGGRAQPETTPMSATPVVRPAPTERRGTAKDAARLLVWMTEEWLRQLLASTYTLRGYIVVFDRHFFADYHGSSELVRSAAPKGLLSRAHRWMLAHLYPRPDLVICLDAPAEVLWARKQEDSLEWLEARRQQYLNLADEVAAFVRVDVDRPLHEVHADVVRAIHDHCDRNLSAA